MDSISVYAPHLPHLMSVSKETVHSWERTKKIIPYVNANNQKFYKILNLSDFPILKEMSNSKWDAEEAIVPLHPYYAIELFAGAGGLALGLEKAGFKNILSNDVERDACLTLKKNRNHWNVIQGDISKLCFKEYQGKIDVLAGGFPCQSFSYAGKRGGLEDTRGTLFFEYARSIQEISPKVFLAENVKGLISHNNGETLATIKSVLRNLGYTLVEPQVLKAIFYKTPQKRERLFIIGIKNDLYNENLNFSWPAPYKRIMTLKDAFKKGELFDSDVPPSEGQIYPEKKKAVLSLVPQGGYWKDLPDDIQREYMGGSYLLGGGKTGIARRLSWDEPSLTLTCSPAQKQTERCHPEETRPLTVREYARVQTFPDSWEFIGSKNSQYKQIGNAVPVNLAWAVGRKIIDLLNQIDKKPLS